MFGVNRLEILKRKRTGSMNAHLTFFSGSEEVRVRVPCVRYKTMQGDPYYIPPHISAPFSKEEIEAYKNVYRQHDVADGDADGFIEIACLDELLKSVRETPTDAKVC